MPSTNETSLARRSAASWVLACFVGPFTAGVIGVGCSSSTPDPVVVVPTASASATEVDPTASASASPAAGAPISAASGGGSSARTTTPGGIVCGSTTCKLGEEVCCAGLESAKCVAAGKGNAAVCAADALERRCDEASDCGANERCKRFYVRGAWCDPAQRWACAPNRAANGAPTIDEVCLAGSKCSLGDCASDGGEDGTGTCPVETVPPVCGATRCKAGEACFWNTSTRAGKCGPAGAEMEFGNDTYACQRKGDCEPGFACYSSLGLSDQHGYECKQLSCGVTRVVDGPWLCETIADCPDDSIVGAGTIITGCVHAPEDPPGVKHCEFK